MQNKLWLAAAGAVLAGSMVFLSGCFRQPSDSPAVAAESGKKWFGPASAVTASHLRLFVVAGAALAVAGGLGGFLFRSPALAASLGGVGVALGAAATLFIEYPWFLLLVSLGGMLILGAHILCNMRTIEQKAEAAKLIVTAVEKAEGGESVKEQIAAMGVKAESLVKRLVTPIKEGLKLKEGLKPVVVPPAGEVVTAPAIPASMPETLPGDPPAVEKKRAGRKKAA